jgi:hypothetical protein
VCSLPYRPQLTLGRLPLSSLSKQSSPPLRQVTLEAGKWRRFRIVHSGTIATLEITLPGCEMDLLAKDGIYLRNNPRRITTVYVSAPSPLSHSCLLLVHTDKTVRL